MFRNGLQPTHIIVLLVIVVLLFGANRLPTLAKSVGQSLKIFKREIQDLTDDSAKNAPATPTVAATAAEPVVAPTPTAASGLNADTAPSPVGPQT